MSSLDSALSKVEYVDLIRALHDKLQHDASTLLNRGLEMSNLLLVLDLAMKEVGKIKTLVGIEKRAVVVAVVKKFLNDRVEEVKNQLNDTANQINEAGAQIQEHVDHAQEHVEQALDKLSDELKELLKLADNSLDSFVDQLYQLAPEVYGKTRSKCKLFWTCKSCK